MVGPMRALACAFSISLALVFLSGCRSGCTEDEAKATVLAIMEQVYYFNDEPAQRAKYASIDLSRFADADELLDYLRYEPDLFDRGFSHLTTPAEEAQFNDEGQYVGLGFRTGDGAGDLLVLSVYADTPAEAAGLARGDRILEIEGRTIAEIEAAEGLAEAFGPRRVGLTLTLLVRKLGGAESMLDLTKAVVNIDTVPVYDVFSVGSDSVGYFYLDSFIGPANDALDQAFAFFLGQNVSKLVIDLRYNGGGFVSVAERLGNLLASHGHVGAIQFEQRYNQNLSRFDRTARFADIAGATDLETVVFITTDRSASASELIINVLDPYLDVWVVGSDTFGKPVGQGGWDFCDDSRRLRAVAFETVNSAGFGGYFDGLAADCAAEDDLTRALGDQDEASLATALAVIEAEACPVTAEVEPRLRGAPPAYTGRESLAERRLRAF